jgi:hypothetical protein
MKTFAFISRHNPTEKQISIALAMDITLKSVPDLDAFGPNCPKNLFCYLDCEVKK